MSATMVPTVTPTATFSPTQEECELGTPAGTGILQILMGIIVMTLMLGMGACTRVEDYVNIMKSPKAPLIGFVSQFGIMPCLAYGLAKLLNVSDATALSMIMIGCTPGGTTSNLFAYFSNGDVSLSIGMTVVSGTMAFVMMPLMIGWLGAEFMEGECGASIPMIELVKGLALVLVPVPIGMCILARDERMGKKVEKLASKIGVWFIVIAVIQQAITNTAIWDSEWYVWVSALVMFPFGCAFGYWLARACCLTARQARTVCLETGIQSTTVTMAVILISFPAGASLESWRAITSDLKNPDDGFPVVGDEDWDTATTRDVDVTSYTSANWEYNHERSLPGLFPWSPVEVTEKDCLWVNLNPGHCKDPSAKLCDLTDWIPGRCDLPGIVKDGELDKILYGFEACYPDPINTKISGCSMHPKFYDANQELQNEMMAFPLLFTLVLLFGGGMITLYFWHSSRYEKEDEVKEKEANKVTPVDEPKKERKAVKPFSLPPKPTFGTWFNMSSDVILVFNIFDWIWFLLSTLWGKGLIEMMSKPSGGNPTPSSPPPANRPSPPISTTNPASDQPGCYLPLCNSIGKVSLYASDGDHIRRNQKTVSAYVSHIPGMGMTAHELIQDAFKSHPDADCMGTRKFLGMYKGEKERFPRKVFDKSVWTTCSETSARALGFGAGLRTLGCEPLPAALNEKVTNSFASIDGPHCILVFEETCADWMTGVIGAMSQSIVVATSYATLGMGAVAEAINQTNSAAIVCNYKDVSRVSKLKEQCPSLSSVIYTRNYISEKEPAHPETMNGCQVRSFDEVVALGVESGIAETPPTPDHLGLIMYTSGSTGKPKGVMLRHKSIVASVTGMFNYLTQLVPLTFCVGKTYIAYLPAAHILEFVAECACLAAGFRVGYSDTKTITSAGAYHVIPPSADPKVGTVSGKRKGTDGGPKGGAFNSETPPKRDPLWGFLWHSNIIRVDGKPVKRKASADMKFAEEFGWLNGDKTGYGHFPAGGIQEFAPTLMAAVPKIWDIMKKGVEQQIGLADEGAQKLMAAGYAHKTWALQQGRTTPFWDWMLFYRFKSVVGGKAMLFITGGGPINPDVQNFISVMLGVPLIQGYALTETCCSGTIQPHWSAENGIVGPPLTCNELRLNNCSEVKDRVDKPYLNTDTQHVNQRCEGRGEVWVRGDCVSAGYYIMEEKSREAFTPEGWFRTGDIAIWTTKGNLKIVDRLKNLIKLKGGEYIAIESMESTYANSVFVNVVSGGLLCFGNGDMDKPVALVQVDVRELQNWAKMNGLANVDDIEALCANEQCIKAVTADMNAKGKGKLGANEALASVALISGLGSPDTAEFNSPWTPENQCLTASNKLNRKPLERAFEKVLAPLIKKGIR